MKTVKTHRLTRRQISTVDDIDWKVRIGDPLCESDPIRVRCRVWTWSYQPPSELSLGSPCNGNLDISIDNTSWKTGLGTGNEEKLVDELVTEKFPSGEHTVTLHLSSGGPNDIEMEIIEEN